MSANRRGTVWMAILLVSFAGFASAAREQGGATERSEMLAAVIRRAGEDQAKSQLYPDEGNGAAGVVSTTAEFYEWVFTRVRK